MNLFYSKSKTVSHSQSPHHEDHYSTIGKQKMVDATPRQILLYLPNLIGYTRILLSITSLTLMIFSPTSYILSSVLYLSSFIGDLFDGMVARKYNQTSTFGGLMDMVTDRCSTTGLLCVLIREFADKSGFVLVSIVFVCTHSV